MIARAAIWGARAERRLWNTAGQRLQNVVCSRSQIPIPRKTPQQKLLSMGRKLNHRRWTEIVFIHILRPLLPQEAVTESPYTQTEEETLKVFFYTLLLYRKTKKWL
nr:MAG TPA: hypothetical protein [Bacteriophage sp.]